jgi:hypothetical protein
VDVFPLCYVSRVREVYGSSWILFIDCCFELGEVLDVCFLVFDICCDVFGRSSTWMWTVVQLGSEKKASTTCVPSKPMPPTSSLIRGGYLLSPSSDFFAQARSQTGPSEGKQGLGGHSRMPEHAYFPSRRARLREDLSRSLRRAVRRHNTMSKTSDTSRHQHSKYSHPLFKT